MRRLIFIALLIFISPSVFPESFKANKVVRLDISQNGVPTTIVAGANDGLLIQLPEDMSFIEGLELTFKLPSEIAQIKNSMTWTLYDGIFPSPSENSRDYSGTKKASGTFGNTYSHTMKIILKQNSSIKKDLYSNLIPYMPEIVDGKIFILLKLGFKDSLDLFNSSQLKITGKPIFVSKGKLLIETTFPDEIELPYTLLIDGNISKFSGKEILLPPGIHTVAFMSDYFRNEQRTISVEQGKTQNLRIDFTSIVPTLKITAPDGTKVYLDGNVFGNTNTPQEIKQGEHNIRFVFGNYELVKNLTAVNGRNYTVNVVFDAQIVEDDFQYDF